MKLSIILLTIWFTALGHAESGGPNFLIEGKRQAFSLDQGNSLLVSRECRNQGGKTCQALLAWKKTSAKSAAHAPIPGGLNPGAYLCKNVLRQEIVIGTDAHGNESSFCRFGDGSLLDNGSLAAAFSAKP